MKRDTRIQLLFFLVFITLTACQPGSPDYLTAENRAWLLEHEDQLEVLFGYQAPPSAFHDENGNYVGLLVDFLHEIEEQLDIGFKYKNFDTWDELIEYAKTGNNFIIVGIAQTAARSEYLSFTDSFIKVPYVIVTRKNSAISTMGNLDNQIVCTVINYAINDYLARYFPTISPNQYIDDLEGLWAVSTGECDAMIINQMYASYLIDNQGITNLEIAGESGYLIRLSAAASTQDPELFNILEKTIDQIDIKRQQEVYREWVNVSPMQPSRAALLAMQIGAISAGSLLILLWLWSVSLRRRVATQTRQIRENEEKYRLITSNTPSIIFSTDDELKITFINRVIDGSDPANIIGQHIRKFSPDDQIDFVMEQIESVRKTHQPVHYEIKSHEQFGEHWLDVQIEPVIQKNQITGFVCTLTDITERKRATEALRESEKRYQDIASQLPGAIYQFRADTQGNFFMDYLSRGAEELFDTKLEKLTDPTQMFSSLHPNDYEAFIASIHESQKQLTSWVHEFRVVWSSDQSIHWIRGRSNPRQEPNGDVIWNGVLLNITETKIAEDLLEKRVEERTKELDVRVGQVEKLNSAMTNLLTDLRSNQHSLETAQTQLRAAHLQLQETHIQEQAALLRLSQGLLELNEPQSIIDFAVKVASQAVSVEFSAIALVDESGENFGPRAWDGWPNEARIKTTIPLDTNTAMAEVIRTKEPLAFADIKQETQFAFPAPAAKMGFSAALIVPIQVGEQIFGGLALHDKKTRQWHENDIRLLSLIANTTAQGLERARLFIAERNARNLAVTVASIAQELSASLELGLVLARVLDHLGQVVPHDTSAIFVARPSGEWDMVVGQGFENTSLIVEQAKPITVSSPIMQRMAKDLQPLLIPDVRKYPDWIWVPGAEHVRAFMAVPLVARNHLVGVLMVDSEKPGFYKQSDLETAQSIVQHVSQAIDNALLFGQVEEGRQRLSRLSQRLVDIQEQERRNIARELHDEVGQILTALTISLDSISQIAADTTIQDRITDFQNITQELINQINSLSAELRPRVLDDLGLEPGLVALINRVSKQTGIQIDFKHSRIERKHITPNLEINAYRLVQEALTNIVRHANVSQASVRLWMEPDTLCIQVQDEGVGFKLQSALKSEDSMGLIGMTERVEMAGGILKIDSAPGEGTTITAAFPVGDQPLERRKHVRDQNYFG